VLLSGKEVDKEVQEQHIYCNYLAEVGNFIGRKGIWADIEEDNSLAIEPFPSQCEIKHKPLLYCKSKDKMTGPKVPRKAKEVKRVLGNYTAFLNEKAMNKDKRTNRYNAEVSVLSENINMFIS
jgi:hypothetical protein